MPLILLLLVCALPVTVSGEGKLIFSSAPEARFKFEGFAGTRIDANVANWLLPAPAANPGMIEMFRVRDRQPVPNLVPWAGEFAGKYLISAVQAMRMSPDPALRTTVSNLVSELISTQADDGYLGPFRQQERLLGHWDLWGHYHCMQGLLMWYETTGEVRALQTVRKAADLVCNTYLDTGKRALDAKSDEMNLSIIHALGWLYRITGEDRYFRMMREIEKDWEKAGDYLRAGLNGVEFFQSPRPRWESLHNLQGLVELYRITGDQKYRRAFEHHWRSIARWDLRNSGGFSSGEQATGNPYANTAIETCCTIAWMAISVDMLALTGDSRVVDQLELSTLNGWAGAQHPSGRWCTYNTPMDGVRESSAHSIVFQSRHGTPELNCCSVNGPRGWGMLSDWAVMREDDGLVLNWLGPARVETKLADGRPVQLQVTGSYPRSENIDIRANVAGEMALKIRVPAWAQNARIRVGEESIPLRAGRYHTIRRHWNTNQPIRLSLDMKLRAIPGANEARGKVSIYRGPLLLAYDQKLNPIDPGQLSPVSLAGLGNARFLDSDGAQVLVEVPTTSGILRLCDFASAGATGTHYRSWLPSEPALPPSVVTRRPADSKTIAPGDVAFVWTGPKRDVTYTLQISDTEDFTSIVHEIAGLTNRQAVIGVGSQFKSNRWYYWQVVTEQGGSRTPSVRPSARFMVDATMPRASESLPLPLALGAKGQLVSASMKSGEQRTFNGIDQKALYPVGSWPEDEYSVRLRVRITEFPPNRLAQIFSAWTAPMDDPLRLCIDKGQLYARIEAGGNYSTQGIPVELNRWYELLAVKAGSKLTLYVDGKERASCSAPEFIQSKATDFALAGNPHYSGNEHLAAEVAELLFFPSAVVP